MRSLQVAHIISDPEEQGCYSDLQVLRSAAGYYIGTTYTGEYGEEPGSRDSGYYRSFDEASEALESGDWDYRLMP